LWPGLHPSGHEMRLIGVIQFLPLLFIYEVLVAIIASSTSPLIDVDMNPALLAVED